MNKKWILRLLLAGLVALLAACSNSDDSAENNDDGSDAQEEEEKGDGEQADMPEPDLDDVPDVVAEVNGKEIEKEDFENLYVGQFQNALMQAQMSGQEVDQDQLKTQIADAMVGQELVIQEAENSDFDTSEEDINKTLDAIVEQNGLESKEEFMDAMEEQDMDEEEVMAEVEKQAKVNQLIASESGDIEVTDKEMQELYDQFKERQEQMGGEDDEDQEVPSFEDMKPEIEEQLKGQKEDEAYQKIVDKLREDADVTINI